MDAIEASRRRAAEMHAAAVSRGLDPFKPLDLVLSEVEEAGFGAEPAEPGAAQLGNAQAKFDPSLGLILYSDVGSDFDKAFLVAHELGHAVLGDAKGACEADPERSSEPAPDGEERVIAHGPRQRREVQMDIFARELLLPRPFVRCLHLDDDMSATDIALKMGASVGAVYQQLLDALLLPEITPDGRPRRLKPLNDRQRDAAKHRGEAYLLEAGPGTGKTQTLSARVGELLATGVDPRRILVLTFSNRAAAELTDRIAGQQSDALSALWIGTFHGFGLDVLHTFGDRIGRSRKPTLLDRASAVALLEDELPRLNLVHHRNLYDPTTVVSDMLAAISRAQDEMCDCAAYAKLADAMLVRAQALDGEARKAAIERAERAQEVAQLYKRYEQIKREGDLVDFGDLVMLAVQLLETDETAKAHYRDRYNHVLIDEYQDVNRASVRLIKALRPTGQGLWAVGDAHQSIYRFRGASSRNMALFKRDFPDAKDGGLIVNYRSSGEIVDLFNRFAKTMVRTPGNGDPPARPHEDLRSDAGASGRQPDFMIAVDKSTLVPVIANQIEADVKAGGHYRDHCVLVSGNDRLAAIGRELEAMGLPVLFLGSLFERPEVKDLLCLLSLAHDPWGSGLVRVAMMPEFQMDLAQVTEVMTALKDPGTPSGALLNPNLAAGLSPSAAGALQAVARALDGVGHSSRPWTVLAEILFDRTRIGARLASGRQAGEMTRAIAVWQFMNFAKSVRGLAAPAIPSLLKRVRRLIRLGDERELRHLPACAAGIDAVRLMTIHGAKGLEFATVHLPGLNADTLPKRPHLGRPACLPPIDLIAFARGDVDEELAISHLEEQDCLLYVALSRAERGLNLYRCESTRKGATREESSFVARLGLTGRVITPSRLLPPSPDTVPVLLHLAGADRIPVWRLARYRSCPRRFFYTHVLRIGGAAEPTPYKLVHDIARRICRELAGMVAVPNAEEVARLTRAACRIPELMTNGYFADFEQLAVDFVGFYADERRSLTGEPTTVMSIEVDGLVVELEPHDVVSDGAQRSMWLIQTRHARSKFQDELDVRTLIDMAGDRGIRAEILHLADRSRSTVEPKRGAAASLRKMLRDDLTKIREGRFPTMEEPNPRVCGGCPALLICHALPPGRATLTF
ncbi:ImmA/IrrE family metallo-endopeptidase (plasmid) [Rhizobium leguminosarum]|uniref:DNA 3'-5' helicase n=1 Tax=Rhizobium leguminosarum TaxID=384 RepID=A0A7M3DIH9_RHILE|nr:MULTISPECIES: UvrD-helicase domain-containing protein [Rhizobium]TAU37394.1 ImmA/IrrE family metallo-endopeptidase [Rhizobium ruizarguesonis]TAU46513.1 ImmA/IrrE family metallo-endopeptidase [Rhizobium ruizarguesonis]TAY41476.1 ImmA/IrrE family metallo-endopeptidase [Rhizobium leguminosarum]TBC86858.1 ImmA/IrrE family metallo-endopeptidase [Rhizobium leguminosarum]TBE74706.1 ImmA/IrrE family metallo-endopeptidase [Rhizobium leguminosarum]